MPGYFLTDKDMATLSNALCIARDACRDDAKKAEGRVKVAFTQSAEQYENLHLVIELADYVTSKE